jgi:hypothetical protein
MHKFLTVLFLLISSSILIAGCDSGQLPPLPLFPGEETPGLVDTRAAQTIAFDQTQRAPTSTPTIRPTRELRTPTPTYTVIVTPTNTLEPTPLPTALFSDDFSSNTGWASEDHEGYSYGLAKGGYFISVDIPKATIWSAKSIEASDISLETQATQLEGPDNAYYGVMCHRQRDGFNYYILVISSNGSYGIGKVTNGSLQFIQEGVDESGIIQRGGASNLITGDCIADKLTLSVNDQVLLEVVDDQYASGTIGLVAGLREGEGLYVLFDYFIAREP